MKVQGVIPPIVTPLHEDETVHEEHLRRVTDHMIDAGVHGIFVNDTMGAFNLLTDSQQDRAIEIVVDQAAGRVPILAGVSDTSPGRVIPRSQRAQRAGADLLSLLPPFFGHFTREQIVRFYAQIARDVDIPILVYNNPWKMVTALDVPTMLELAQIPGIAGIKDANGDVGQYCQIVSALGGRPDFSIIIQTVSLNKVAMFIGADGLCEGRQNLRPQWWVALWNAARSGDWATASAMEGRIASLNAFDAFGDFWGGMEAALHELGLVDKITPRPYCSLTDREEKSRVSQLVRELLLAG
jgi:4-hydroxy-tetrahydrodipicolinate synthase